MSDLDLILTRRLPASPARVWRCWTEPDLIRQWFAPKPVETREVEIDLRPGGRFYTLMVMPDGTEYPNEGCILLVEPERRLVYVYDMHLGEVHHSLSLTTLELRGDRGATRFRYTEQLAFLDGTDAVKGTVSRKHGTSAHFERLAVQLGDATAAAG